MEESNGVYVNVENDLREDTTLYGVLNGLISTVLSPDPSTCLAGASLQQRFKLAVSEKGPVLRDASRSTARDLLTWTRQGSPLRALLLISVGTICGLALTGLFVFMLFFVAVTVNAVVISLLMSLAMVGAFLVLFFAGLTAIYIGTLSVAVFVIATATLSAITAVLVVTAWVGIFFVIWLATKKSMGLAKQTLNISASALSAYSDSRNAGRHEANKRSD